MAPILLTLSRRGGLKKKSASLYSPTSLVLVCVCVCVCVCVLSNVQFFSTPRTVAHQVLLSMECPRQEHWSGLPFPSLEDLPNPRIEHASLVLAGRLPLHRLGIFTKRY